MFEKLSFTRPSLIVFSLLQPMIAHADTAYIYASSGYVEDASIYQDAVNNSNGAGPGIFSGGNAGPSPRRALVFFDVYNYDVDVLGGALSNASSINSVTLHLMLGKVAGSGGGSGDSTPRVIKLYKVTNGMWGEGTTGSSATTIGGTGGGFPANSGDATWNAYSYSSPSWNNAGGDYSGTVSASTTVSQTLNTTYNWSHANMVSDIQAWLNSPSTNYGWILINDDESSSTTFRAFYSKEAEPLSLGTGPILEINYTP
ncbi:DNRLRE domain-containing protein [Methylomonas sp. MgM2]